MNTQLKSDQTERGWSSLGDTKFGSTPSDNAADNNSRRFCFGCHVASDGSGTSTVENLSQAGSNKLKLPSTYGIEEHKASGGQGCQRCHYGRNYNDNTYGPHYPATGLCDTCHESQGTKSAAAVSYNGGHKKHVDNTTYRFACKECHSWTKGSGQAVHKNDNSATAIHAEVAFDNQGSSNWDNIYYAVSTAYKYRSLYTNPYGVNLGSPSWSGGVDNGTDAKQSLVKWKNGSCSNVWCHSTAYSDNVARTVAWVEGGLPSDCTGCHGGGSGVAAASRMGAANNGSQAHLAHINSNLKCYKCHYGTVTPTSQDNVIAVYDNHVNGVKNVRLASDVGGTYDNSNKTCSATYCHGTPAPLPDWDNVSTVSGCSSCHPSQGAGSGTATYTGAHAKHADNAAGGRYLFACEACHARSAASQANGVHAGGDDNTSGPRTVDLKFTDNIFSSWTYDAGSRTYRSFDFWTNPYGAAAPSPGYADNSALGGTDTQNGSITWTIGNCSNVWCHSNANPASSGGGANTYRSPSWAGSVACTSCHLGRDTYANMGAASDRL
ncbi:MAG: CxxxxCH/CxxCH domain-containing protein, partial [Geobacter sp.]|nr:CxxxxCH/CxxCH domain-containing protein [Geobacter sp.]